MSNRITLFFLLSFLLVISSCKKNKEDEQQLPYDYAQGTWFFESECPDIPAGFEFIEDILPESVNIQGEGDGLLSLTIVDTITIYGNINDTGYIIVEEQELFSFDTIIGGFFPLSIPFTVSGSGIIASQDSGRVNLDYSATVPSLPIPIPGFESFDFSCTAFLSREEGEDPGE